MEGACGFNGAAGTLSVNCAVRGRSCGKGVVGRAKADTGGLTGLGLWLGREGAADGVTERG